MVSDINNVVSVFALAGSIVSLLSVFYLAASKIAKLEVKVDTMWMFQMRRAFSEAVDRGVATANSPLTFHGEALERLQPIAPALKEFWQEKGRSMSSDANVLLEIEKEFGHELIERVCIPCNLTHGACLLLAYAVASGKDKIDLSDIQL